jgi:hypothetical protein
LEVADIFRGHGSAWREANAGHVSLGQLKVLSAIESCRTAALGGHVARCLSSQSPRRAVRASTVVIPHTADAISQPLPHQSIWAGADCSGA